MHPIMSVIWTAVIVYFRYTPDSLRLGDLSGNKFTVVLRWVTCLTIRLPPTLSRWFYRNVSCDDHVISKAVKSLGELGFINYFGMQRFGTSSIPTHHVGRCLIHSDWKGAIDLILKPRPGGETVNSLHNPGPMSRPYHNNGGVSG